MTAKDELTKILGAKLREFGYRKNQKAGWKQDFDEGYRLISIQMSQFNEATDISFTFNVGVLFPKVEDVFCRVWNKKPSKTLDVTMGTPYERIGWVIAGCQNSYRDIWWSINSGTDIDELGTEISLLLADKCVPVLSELDRMRLTSDLSLIHI